MSDNKIWPLCLAQNKVISSKACKKHWKQELSIKALVPIAQNKTETYKMCLFESQILFCKGAGTASINVFIALN